jgi:hypothetical protein
MENSIGQKEKLADTIEGAAVWMAPNSYPNYKKCVRSHCSGQYHEYQEELPKHLNKINECREKYSKMSQQKRRHKCVKEVIKPIKKTLKTCVKKNCKKEYKFYKHEIRSFHKDIYNEAKKAKKVIKASNKRHQESEIKKIRARTHPKLSIALGELSNNTDINSHKSPKSVSMRTAKKTKKTKKMIKK